MSKKIDTIASMSGAPHIKDGKHIKTRETNVSFPSQTSYFECANQNVERKNRQRGCKFSTGQLSQLVVCRKHDRGGGGVATHRCITTAIDI